MNYYIADLHFGFERVLVIDKLDVESAEKRNKLVIARWNSVVADDDDVYIAGDIMWETATQDKAFEIVKKLKGRKHLAVGNHDKMTSDEFKKCFVSIEGFYDIIDNGRPVFVSHYPIMFYPHQHRGGYMIYGHVHKSHEYSHTLKWSEELSENGVMSNMFNVGCMLKHMDFTPRTLDELIKHGKEIKS